MRVLLIVSNAVDNAHEIEWIGRAYHTEVLHDPTTAILYEYISGHKYDILHFAAHGSEDGVALAHGSFLTMFDLERIARSVGAQLIYLNSCSSARLAQFLVDQGIPAVVATTANVLDSAAWSIAISFYQELQETSDFYQAYEQAKPMDGTVSFYSNGHNISRQILPVLDRLDGIEAVLSTAMQRERFLYGAVAALWVTWLVSFAYSYIHYGVIP